MRIFTICIALHTQWIRWAVHMALVEVNRKATSGFGAAT